MEFTGERYLPSLGGEIKYEHLHRYALAQQFAAGKSALDIASGEGYGAALLARSAASVTGVDLDAEAVRHASERYGAYPNLNFLTGSCQSIPLSDHSVDLVTSFETIEHHDRHQEMMREIKRVLRPGGLLILSSPNKTVYTDQRKQTNEYHVKELYQDELIALLRTYFRRIEIYGQRMAIGSVIYSLADDGETKLQLFSGDNDKLAPQMAPLNDPLYYIALCSDQDIAVSQPCDSIFFDPSDDLYKEQFDLINSWRRQLESLQAAGPRIEQADQILNSRAWRWVQRLRRIRSLAAVGSKQPTG
jgi:ubiquinone/menaquinone biosynthesis C-methylase UbiE